MKNNDITRRHLTEKEIAGLFSSPDKQHFLSHISHCDLCAARLAKSLEAGPILHAPRYMKQNILSKTKLVQRRKREYKNYCLKIGIAVAASLALLFLPETGTVSFITSSAWEEWQDFQQQERREYLDKTNTALARHRQAAEYPAQSALKKELEKKTSAVTENFTDITDKIMNIFMK